MISFGDPRGWWLLAAAAILFLVLLIRLRRRRITLSTFILLRSIAQRLPFLPRSVRALRQISRLLFAGAVLCLVLAGFRPSWRSSAPAFREVAVIDLSPSLGVVDAGVPRARRLNGLLEAYFDLLQPEDTLHLVLAGPVPEVSPGFRGSREAREWLGGLEPRDAEADIAGAAALARRLVARERPDHVLIFTDLPARWERHAVVPGDGPPPHLLGEGAPAGNAGIVAFDVRPDLRGSGRYDLYARVARHPSPRGSSARELAVRVFSNAREVRSFSSAELAARGEEILLEGLDLDPGQVEVRLDPPDALAADDAARGGVGGGGGIPVVLLSSGNRFLSRALEADPAVSLKEVGPNDPLPRVPDAVYVFDTLVPEGELPERALFILPSRNLEGLGQSAYLPPPWTITTDESDPVMRGVTLANLTVRGYLGFERTSSFRAVAAADGRPLIQLGEDPRRRWAVLAFDPSETNLVYTPSYPILVANLLRWLSALSRGERASFTAGEQVHLPRAAAGGIVRLPGGRAERIPDGTSAPPLARAGRAGRYSVEGPGGKALGDFFVNTVSPAVTAEPAREGYGRGGKRLPEELERPVLHRDLTRWLVYASIALLALEALVRPRAVSGRE